MLQPEDIQPRAGLNLHAGAEYPVGSHYTLQRIVPLSNPINIMLTPNNVDARFVTGTNIPKPSDLLLHYNFGAAVVKYWCRNQNILVERPNIPRPKPEDPTSKKRYISISIAMLLGRNEVAERKGMLAGVISKNLADLELEGLMKVAVRMKMTLRSSLGVILHKLELST